MVLLDVHPGLNLTLNQCLRSVGTSLELGDIACLANDAFTDNWSLLKWTSLSIPCAPPPLHHLRNLILLHCVDVETAVNIFESGGSYRRPPRRPRRQDGSLQPLCLAPAFVVVPDGVGVDALLPSVCVTLRVCVFGEFIKY